MEKRKKSQAGSAKVVVNDRENEDKGIGGRAIEGNMKCQRQNSNAPMEAQMSCTRLAAKTLQPEALLSHKPDNEG